MTDPNPTPSAEEAEARRALKCLYLAADPVVCEDVAEKVFAWVRSVEIAATTKEKKRAALVAQQFSSHPWAEQVAAAILGEQTEWIE
jgi:tRNA-dihydrouridine synthase